MDIPSVALKAASTEISSMGSLNMKLRVKLRVTSREPSPGETETMYGGTVSGFILVPNSHEYMSVSPS